MGGTHALFDFTGRSLSTDGHSGSRGTCSRVDGEICCSSGYGAEVEHASWARGCIGSPHPPSPAPGVSTHEPWVTPFWEQRWDTSWIFSVSVFKALLTVRVIAWVISLTSPAMTWAVAMWSPMKLWSAPFCTGWRASPWPVSYAWRESTRYLINVST